MHLKIVGEREGGGGRRREGRENVCGYTRASKTINMEWV